MEIETPTEQPNPALQNKTQVPPDRSSIELESIKRRLNHLLELVFLSIHTTLYEYQFNPLEGRKQQTLVNNFKRITSNISNLVAELNDPSFPKMLAVMPATDFPEDFPVFTCLNDFTIARDPILEVEEPNPEAPRFPVVMRSLELLKNSEGPEAQKLNQKALNYLNELISQGYNSEIEQKDKMMDLQQSHDFACDYALDCLNRKARGTAAGDLISEYLENILEDKREVETQAVDMEVDNAMWELLTVMDI